MSSNESIKNVNQETLRAWGDKLTELSAGLDLNVEHDRVTFRTKVADATRAGVSVAVLIALARSLRTNLYASASRADAQRCIADAWIIEHRDFDIEARTATAQLVEAQERHSDDEWLGLIEYVLVDRVKTGLSIEEDVDRTYKHILDVLAGPKYQWITGEQHAQRWAAWINE